MLGYEPIYTSYLKKRTKKGKGSKVEEGESSKNRKGEPSRKGKEVVAIEVSSDSEIDLHRTKIQDLIGKVREPRDSNFDEGIMGGDLDDLPSLVHTKRNLKPKRLGPRTLPPLLPPSST